MPIIKGLNVCVVTLEKKNNEGKTQVLGVWSNLKKLCDVMQTETNGNFVSYSKLSKMRIKSRHETKDVTNDKGETKQKTVRPLDGEQLEFLAKDGTPYTIHILTVQ